MKTNKFYRRELRTNQTQAEKLLWYYLRNRKLGTKFRRQQSVGKYIVDFVSFERKIIIELDGNQHNLKDRKLKDDTRTDWLTGEGFLVVRFWNNEVLRSIEDVLERIKFMIRR